MSLNSTPSGERIHIGIFGRRNAGKSSLINALASQSLAIVSDCKGTTTDPVHKAMELLPLGPVMMIDTPGIDDEGELGQLRVSKAYQVLNKTDIALLVVDSKSGLCAEDIQLWQHIQSKKIPSLLVFNKKELLEEMEQALLTASALKLTNKCFFISAANNTNIHELKEAIAALAPKNKKNPLVNDILVLGDVVVMVTPIDSAAPKGRLILPQQQILRNIIDKGAIAIVTRETELQDALGKLCSPPRLVITDSQVFGKVNKMLSPDIPLTSFSILMARYKGNLYDAVHGVRHLDNITNGDKILISEGCTHHRQCGDIGTVKLPAWIRSYTKSEPIFEFTSGTEFPTDLSPYKLVIHCGACMLNEREIQHRYSSAVQQNIPITNYGIAIAYMNGILKRTVEPLPEISSLLK